MQHDDEQTRQVASPDLTVPRAPLAASAQDTRIPRQFLDALLLTWVRDAQLMDGTTGSGVLLAGAGEVAEFGCGDADRAELLFQRGSVHPDGDPRAFSGLRRATRRDRDARRLAEVYRAEIRAERSPTQVVLAAIGLALLGLRDDERPEKLLSILRDAALNLPHVGADVSLAYRVALEDVLIRSGKFEEALSNRAARWSEFEAHAGTVSAAHREGAALSLAVATEVLGGSERDRLEWYQKAFEAHPTIEAARPLLRAAYDRGDFEEAEQLLAELCRAAEGADLRGACLYELGMLRAWRRSDRAGALESMRDAMGTGVTAPLAAASFLSLSRGSEGAVVPDELVDALDSAIYFAASGLERADLLTQMARRIADVPERSGSAIDLVREALQESPGYKPAIRLLGSLLHREARWGALAELTEDELQLEADPGEQLRLHERLADLHWQHLADPTAAERHLRHALALQLDAPIVRRLARLLGEQMRWEEVYELLKKAAAGVPIRRDRIAFCEEAAHVAEARLRDLDRAIDCYRLILDAAPEHPTAIVTLGRLYSARESWSDLLELNESELAMTPGDTRARLAILCRSADSGRSPRGRSAGTTSRR